GWVLDELEDGNNVPPASNSKSINLKSNEFINFVVLDIDSYAEKFGNKAIRKNCTIPSWLNYQAERAGINFSQTLQEAIKQQLHIS
ncbi:MAG: HicB family protein, partial [Oscillospiraceae bacterium]